MKITQFEEIEGWKAGRVLTRSVYAASKVGEFARDFGLRDQIRGAAASVMHNIAEGFNSGSNREFIRFLRYAQRSSSEVQSQLYVALDQDYIAPDQFETLYDLANEAHAKVGGFINYLLTCERDQKNGRRTPNHERCPTKNDEQRTMNNEKEKNIETR